MSKVLFVGLDVHAVASARPLVHRYTSGRHAAEVGSPPSIKYPLPSSPGCLLTVASSYLTTVKEMLEFAGSKSAKDVYAAVLWGPRPDFMEHGEP
jgi:hypothetical protein